MLIRSRGRTRPSDAIIIKYLIELFHVQIRGERKTSARWGKEVEVLMGYLHLWYNDMELTPDLHSRIEGMLNFGIGQGWISWSIDDGY